MAPPWSCFGNRLHLLKVEPFFYLILKRYLNGGHPVDMKTAPPWSHFGSTFFFQYSSAGPPPWVYEPICSLGFSLLVVTRPHTDTNLMA